MGSMLKVLLLAASFVGALSIQASAQEINMYDQNGNYRYGSVSPGGQINAYDQNGNYSYGNVSPGGQINMYDQNGNYSYGQINPR
jgi:hypothetical protein